MESNNRQTTIQFAKKTGRSVIIFIGCLFFFTLSSCSQQNIRQEQLFHAINEEHSNIALPDKDISKYAMNTTDAMPLSSLKMKKSRMRNYLSIEEAVDEVNDLFEIFKHNYGLYYYYGEERFHQAREECLTQIRKFTDRIAVYDLQQWYTNSLSFIEDQHFRIEEQPLHQTKTIYFGKNITFDKDDNGFFDEQTNQYIKSISINGITDASQKMIQRVLQDDASLKYQLVVLDSREPDVSIEFQDGSSVKLVMTKYEESFQSKHHIYHFEEKNDIPVIRLLEMLETEHPLMQEFIATSFLVKKNNTIMIDLRNNGGGESFVVERWFLNAFGKYSSRGLEIITEGSRKEHYQDFYELYESFGYQKFNDNYWFREPSDSLSTNDTKIIVLMNQYTTSAGERFVDALHGIENTLFFGTNSMGNYIGSGNPAIYAKYSNISFKSGNNLKIMNQNYFQEYVGIAPDIYYFGDLDMEELIIRYLNL